MRYRSNASVTYTARGAIHESCHVHHRYEFCAIGKKTQRNKKSKPSVLSNYVLILRQTFSHGYVKELLVRGGVNVKAAAYVISTVSTIEVLSKFKEESKKELFV